MPSVCGKMDVKSIEKVVSGAISTALSQFAALSKNNGQTPATFDALSNSDDDFVDPLKIKKR